MKLANLSFLNEPYYLTTIPEYKDQHDIDLHVFRYDAPGKGWKSLFLKYPTGVIPLKEAVDTSYQKVSQHDINTNFESIQPVDLNIEKNIFQIKDAQTTDNARDSIITDINKMLQNTFTIQTYTIEEFEQLLEAEDTPLAKRTLAAIKDVTDYLSKQHIARYYLLHTRGGVYLDPKSVLKRRLEDKYFELDKYDGFVSLYDSNNGIPELGFIACKKNSQLLGAVLDKALTNIEKRFYGTSSQEPTGTLCFRECLNKVSPILKTTKQAQYGEEKYLILRQEAGRLYDNTNRLIWTRDVYTNSTDRRLLEPRTQNSPNLWLQCRLYPDGNCYSLSNWKFYASESSEAQFLIAALCFCIIAAIAIYYYKM